MTDLKVYTYITSPLYICKAFYALTNFTMISVRHSLCFKQSDLHYGSIDLHTLI